MSEQIAQPISERATEITPNEEICLKFLANELQAILAGRKMEELKNEELEKYKAKYQEYVDFCKGINRERVIQKIEAEKPQQFEYAKLVRWAREEVEEDEEWVKRTFEVREDGMIIAKNSLFLGGLKTVTTLPVNLIEVRGFLDLEATNISYLFLPKLETVKGDFLVGSLFELSLLSLQRVGGDLKLIIEDVDLLKLQIVGGNLILPYVKNVNLPELQRCDRCLVDDAVSFNAPNLTDVSSIVFTRGNIENENVNIPQNLKNKIVHD